MNHKGLLFPLLMVLVLLQCTDTKSKLPQAQGEAPTMYQELENSTLSLYDGSRKVWILQAKYMRKTMGDTGLVLAVPVVLTLYDSSGQTGTKVLADSGTTDASKDTFTVWGNVFVRTEDDKTIRAEKLCWSKDRHRVTSDSYVQINTPGGDVLRGKGLDAAENFSWWSLLEDVSGEFPNFQERLDNDEEIIGD